MGDTAVNREKVIIVFLKLINVCSDYCTITAQA